MSPETVTDTAQQQLIERGWAALPAEYRMPVEAPTLKEARAGCKRLAEMHENFHVASWFPPKRQRTHFHSIYAYCGMSDDLGDETGYREQSLALLDLISKSRKAALLVRALTRKFMGRNLAQAAGRQAA